MAGEGVSTMDPKTKQIAPLKPKVCCASPSSCAALLLLPSSSATPWLGGLPDKDVAEGQRG